MYDIDYKTSNSSIIKPFQRIFSKIIHQIHKRPILLFYLNTTTHWQIAFHLYKRKRDFWIEIHPNIVSFLVPLFSLQLYTAQIYR